MHYVSANYFNYSFIAFILESGTAYTSSNDYLSDNDNAFDRWLQCYGKPNMQRLKDSNQRMMWFAGPAGSMARHERKRVIRRKKVQVIKEELPAPKAGPLKTEAVGKV